MALVMDEKKLKLFQQMERKDNSASNAWARLRAAEMSWERAKAKLEKAGCWNEYCDAKGWVRSATFHDIGA